MLGATSTLFRPAASCLEKIIIIAVVAVVLLILLFPIKYRLKDGGSTVYKSLVYEVTKLNRLTGEPDELTVGTIIKLFGNEVYHSEKTVTEGRGDTVDDTNENEVNDDTEG